MKSKKTNILLGIIAINLTLLTLIQLEIWPTKANATELNSNLNSNLNYGLVPLNADGSINVNLTSSTVESMDVNIRYINGHNAANYEAYTISGEKYSSLGVRTTN